jgi:Protein of unknown function (DUF3224)
MKYRTEGRFDVTRTAEPPYDTSAGATLGRSRFDKRFEGKAGAQGAGGDRQPEVLKQGLVGTSVVNMISAVSGVKGSAGYVAIERVEGELDGRAGSFVLQHSGVMDRGATTLVVSVVPDTATGALVGLRGQMSIDTSGGDHRYVFEYDLPE